MKFEKVNNDKIKITLNSKDLEANDIDFHSFMSNSSQTQSLFLAVLDKAERDYGFSTDNYQLKVETVVIDSENFILTITRSKAGVSSSTKKKCKVYRKVPNPLSASLIYKFNTFEDFCSFVEFLSFSAFSNIEKISKSSILYCYNGNYYLVFNAINVKYPYLKAFYSVITEFATYINYSEAFVAKLYESGTLAIKNNAIKICKKYFV